MRINNFNLELLEGPIGISCSGGADSSLLLYLLMKHSKEKIHIFTSVSNFKQRKTSQIMLNVINQCIKLTNNINIEHHFHFCEQQNMKNLFGICRKWIKNGYIKYLYTGLTINPPDEVLNSFDIKLDELERNNRDSTIEKDLFSNQCYMPFRNLNKQDIAELYKYYGLLDTLFPSTRSCEWYPEMGGSDPGLGHCGNCWWCLEREWGFGNSS